MFSHPHTGSQLYELTKERGPKLVGVFEPSVHAQGTNSVQKNIVFSFLIPTVFAICSFFMLEGED